MIHQKLTSQFSLLHVPNKNDNAVRTCGAEIK